MSIFHKGVSNYLETRLYSCIGILIQVLILSSAFNFFVSVHNQKFFGQIKVTPLPSVWIRLDPFKNSLTTYHWSWQLFPFISKHILTAVLASFMHCLDRKNEVRESRWGTRRGAKYKFVQLLSHPPLRKWLVSLSVVHGNCQFQACVIINVYL